MITHYKTREIKICVQSVANFCMHGTVRTVPKSLVLVKFDQNFCTATAPKLVIKNVIKA